MTSKQQCHSATTAVATTRVLQAVVLFLVSIGALSVTLEARADETPDAKQIVERADRIRFPKESFQIDVTITNSDASKNTDVHKYRVLSKSNEDTLVMTTEPPAERGQILLLKGRDLWVFMPNVSQPIRLPLAQRLTGLVANGDLARANFAGDYNAKVLRKDNIGQDWLWVLELNAVDRSVTYDRVMYWVNQVDNRPFKAEFYTKSNRLMKTVFYQNFTPMQGEQRPAQLVMVDNLNQDNKSTLNYSDMLLKELPDKMFTKDYLKKLQ